jgi:hypothetical protein
MGGFYGSVQLRTGDRPRVLAAAEAVASARGIKCLVGTVRSGWAGVYPEGSGQDETVDVQIAGTEAETGTDDYTPPLTGKITLRGRLVASGGSSSLHETAHGITSEGLFRTNDIRHVDANGCPRIFP